MLAFNLWQVYNHHSIKTFTSSPIKRSVSYTATHSTVVGCTCILLYYDSGGASEDLLFSCVAIGDGNVGWAVDVVGRIWFMTDVTLETPIGDGHWWQVTDLN